MTCWPLPGLSHLDHHLFPDSCPPHCSITSGQTLFCRQTPPPSAFLAQPLMLSWPPLLLRASKEAAGPFLAPYPWAAGRGGTPAGQRAGYWSSVPR